MILWFWEKKTSSKSEISKLKPWLHRVESFYPKAADTLPAEGSGAHFLGRWWCCVQFLVFSFLSKAWGHPGRWKILESNWVKDIRDLNTIFEKSSKPGGPGSLPTAKSQIVSLEQCSLRGYACWFPWFTRNFSRMACQVWKLDQLDSMSCYL